MKLALYQTVTGDAGVITLIPASRWYESGAITDTPVKPFGVVRWGTDLKLGPNLTVRTVAVWVHDERGSYDLIDDTLTEVRRVCAAMEGLEVPYTDGVSRITQCDWFQSSGELFDQEYKTNCRFAEFRVAGRER